MTMNCKRYKVSLSDAQHNLNELLGRPSSQTLSLEEARGMRLSEDVIAPCSVPSAQVALRDGLALLSDGALTVMTGEAMPPGSQGLIKRENLGRTGAAADPRHVRQPGQDVRQGERLLGAGTPLDAWHLAVLRSAGVSEVAVWARPRVQLVAPEGGANHRLVKEKLQELGVDLVSDHPQLTVVTAGDEPGAYGRLMAQFDDFPLDIWKVALRPGKHVGIGSRDGIPWVVLPDHLVATWISVILLIEPAVRRLLGEPARPWPEAAVPLQTGEPGMTRVLWASWQGDHLVPLNDQMGQLPVSFRLADALLLVPPEGGDRLPFAPLSWPSCPRLAPNLASP